MAAKPTLVSTGAELEDLASRAKLGFWQYDSAGAQILGSRVFGEIFELDETRVDLDTIAKLYGSDASAKLVRAIELALEDAKPFTITAKVETPSGQRKWVRIRGQGAEGPSAGSRGVIGTIQDISELRLSDRVSQESEMTLNQVEAIANIGHWSVSLEDGAHLHSDEIKRIFGYEPSEYALSPEQAIEAYHPDDRGEVIRLFERAVETGEGYEFDLRVIQPSGDIRHVHSKGYTDQDEHGKVTRVYGVFQDITDRVRAEADKAELEAALHQSQKLEAVGRLAGGVAHDFNNILTAMYGYIDMALMGIDAEGGNELVREALEELELSSERAAALIRQLLAFSRQQVTPADVLDLNVILDGTTSMLRRVVTEDIELAMLLGSKLPHIKIATGQLEQVIMNLVVNASDAMPDGGKLCVESSLVDLSDSSLLGLDGLAPGRYVVLAVSDTGHGIEPEVQARLFEPFFTTKRVGKGTGLGLATVYGIVKQAAGHISVYSEPGSGTVFRVYLPAVEDELTLHETSKPAPTPATGSETILLCEDDEQVRKLSVSALSSAGYEVLVARDGAEGLSKANAHEATIDLLITDVVMPEKSGRALADMLRASRPEMKVLFVSGYTARIIAQRGVLEGQYKLLEKPFTRRSLLDSVRAALDEIPAA